MEETRATIISDCEFYGARLCLLLARIGGQGYENSKLITDSVHS